VNIEEIRHGRPLSDLPYKRRDAAASGQRLARRREARDPAAIQSSCWWCFH